MLPFKPPPPPFPRDWPPPIPGLPGPPYLGPPHVFDDDLYQLDAPPFPRLRSKQQPPRPRPLQYLKQPALMVDLEDQYFTGPVIGNGQKSMTPYTSLCILDPCLTVERHGSKLHVAARFNIETTILKYHAKSGDGNELFFHDVVLQYLNDTKASPKETLMTWPESDPSKSFAVTRSTNSEVSGDLGLSGSGAPSANVSLGLSRSTELTVEYSVGSWSVSAHRVVNSNHIQPRTTLVKQPQYQWYWAGTYGETKHLTTDLKHSVKRHVVMKRIVDLSDFLSPTYLASLERTEADKSRANMHRERRQSTRLSGNRRSEARFSNETSAKQFITADLVNDKQGVEKIFVPSPTPETYSITSQTTLHKALKRLMSFEFHVKVRIKRRHGRFHRILLLSGNTVKAKFLKPVYELYFGLSPPYDLVKEMIDEGCTIENEPPVISGPFFNDTGDIHASIDTKGKEATSGKDKDGQSATSIRNPTGLDDGNNDQQSQVDEGAETPVPTPHPQPDDNRASPPHDQTIPLRTFIFPMGETVDLSEVLEELKEQNNGRWDRLQGRGLKTELDQPAVVSLSQLQHNRKIHAELSRREHQERERMGEVKLAQREVPIPQPRVHREMRRKVPVEMTREVMRMPHRPVQIRREPSLDSEMHRMGGRPTRTYFQHGHGQESVAPRPDQWGDDSDNDDDKDDEEQKNSKGDDE